MVVLAGAAGAHGCAQWLESPRRAKGARRPKGAPTPAEPPAPPVAIVNGTIWTGTGKVYSPGTVLVRGGVIAAIGDVSTPVPAGVRTIDAKGQWVTPGIIDSHSHLGVYPSPNLPPHADGNERSDPVTAEVQAQHGFWPQDPGLSHALAGGVTTLLILPGSANLIGGRGFIIKNRPARSAAAMRFPNSRDMLKMACGENPKRVYGRKKHKAPVTRMGNVAGYRKAFARARDYAGRLERWRRKGRKSRGRRPRTNLALETLAAVLRKEIWVQNHCYRADEMLLMLDIAREFGFVIRSFHHAVEAYKIRDILAKRAVGVSTWTDWWGYKIEMFDSIPESVALLSRAGVKVVIHSDSAIGIQRLNQEAGKALASGRGMGLKLSEQDALRWVTANPAWVLGVHDRTGTLEVGKMADIVVWDKQPLSVYAKAQTVLVDGHLVYDRSRPRRRSDFELGLGARP